VRDSYRLKRLTGSAPLRLLHLAARYNDGCVARAWQLETYYNVYDVSITSLVTHCDITCRL
jgi:hypothetical protein